MANAVALLRAINVGGHTVTMADLRRHFGAAGFVDVSTFIASGNVRLQVNLRRRRVIERRIEVMLREALGYDVATFLRSREELAVVTAHQAFPEATAVGAAAMNVAFLHEVPAAAAVSRVMALRTDIDDFHVHGPQVYWLCRVKQSQSRLSGATIERALGVPATLRSLNSLRRLVASYDAQD